MRKPFWTGFFTAYAITAIMAGAAMGQVIPALNIIGMAYVGATYPIALGCVATGDNCSPVPSPEISGFMFSFKESTHEQ